MKTKHFLYLAACCLIIFAGSFPEEGMFIHKNYGEFKEWPVSCEEGGVRIHESLNYQAYHRYCKIQYVAKDISYLSIVKINFINDMEAAKKVIVKEIMNKDDGAKNNNGDLKRFVGKSTLLVNRNIGYSEQNIFWISDQLLINIYASYMEIPPVIIADYIQKFPPTHVFTAQDLDLKEFFRYHHNGKFKYIASRDSDRGWYNRRFDKYTEFVALLDQCEAERVIRCEVGIPWHEGQIDCPNAFILDDGERKDAYKKMQKDVQSMPVILEKVYWTDLDHAACGPKINYQRKAQEALDMDEDDFPPGYWGP